MPKFTIPHEAWLSQQDPHLQDIVATLVQGFTNLAQQLAANANSPIAAPPPQVSSLTVTPDGNGFIHAQIFDNNPVQRGIQYFLEMSQTSNFAHPIVIPMGPSRDLQKFVGSQSIYYRAYSQYGSASAPSSPVYHGGTTPAVVNAGGSITGSFPSSSAGSGTADSTGTLGGQGFGNEPSRSPRLPL